MAPPANLSRERAESRQVHGDYEHARKFPQMPSNLLQFCLRRRARLQCRRKPSTEAQRAGRFNSVAEARACSRPRPSNTIISTPPQACFEHSPNRPNPPQIWPSKPQVGRTNPEACLVHSAPRFARTVSQSGRIRPKTSRASNRSSRSPINRSVFSNFDRTTHTPQVRPNTSNTYASEGAHHRIHLGRTITHLAADLASRYPRRERAPNRTGAQGGPEHRPQLLVRQLAVPISVSPAPTASAQAAA